MFERGLARIDKADRAFYVPGAITFPTAAGKRREQSTVGGVGL
jgi:hypothetical protein